MKIVAIHWMTKRDVGDVSKKHDGWTHHHECLLWVMEVYTYEFFRRNDELIFKSVSFPSLTLSLLVAGQNPEMLSFFL